MSTSDLLKLLRVSRQSTLYQKLSDSGDQNTKGLLWQLVNELCSQYFSPTVEHASQTYPFGHALPTNCLDDKLLTVEDLYTSKKAELWRKGESGVEDRILTYQKQLERKSQAEVKQQMAQFRQKELALLRREEKEKLREEMAAQRLELENTYSAKFEALQERERNSADRIHKEQEMQARELYAQRQSLLDEIEVVKQREICAKRELENYQREKKLNEDRIQAREDLMKKRETELEKLHREYDVKLDNDMTKFKLEEHVKYIERTQSMDVREISLKENERRIKDDIDNVEGLKQDSKDKIALINNLETQLQELRHNEVTSSKHNQVLNAKLREMVDYTKIKEENAVIRHELEDVKTRLAENMKLYERERSKNEEILRNRNQPNEMTMALQRELDSTRDSLIYQKTLMDQAQANFDIRLKEEINRKAEVINQLEQATIKQRELSQEMEDMRQQLMHARNALNNEVFRKAKRPLYEDNSEEDQILKTKPDNTHYWLPKYADISSDEELTHENRVLHDLTNQYIGISSNRLHNRDDSDLGDADVIAEAKYRLKSLDREAENLQQAYEAFHYRMTSSQGFEKSQQPVDQLKTAHPTPHRVAIDPNLRTPPLSLKNHRNPPLSSTPYKKSQRTSDGKDSKYIGISDLENRTGSPSIKVVPISDSDQASQIQHDINLLPPNISVVHKEAPFSFSSIRQTMDTLDCTAPTESKNPLLLIQEQVAHDVPITTMMTSVSAGDAHSNSVISTDVLDNHMKIDQLLSRFPTFEPISVGTTAPNASQLSDVSLTPSTYVMSVTTLPSEDVGLTSAKATEGTSFVSSTFTASTHTTDSHEDTTVVHATNLPLVSLDSHWKSTKQDDTSTVAAAISSDDIPNYNVDDPCISSHQENDNIDPIMKEYMSKITKDREQREKSSFIPETKTPSMSERTVSEDVHSDNQDAIFDDW